MSDSTRNLSSPVCKVDVGEEEIVENEDEVEGEDVEEEENEDEDDADVGFEDEDVLFYEDEDDEDEEVELAGLLQPFRFEPQAQQAPGAAAAPLPSQDVRVGNTDWCTCGNCEVKTKHVECVCCRGYGQTLGTILENEEPIRCITAHPGFSTVCLDVHVLRTAYHQYHQEHAQDAEEIPTEHEKYRYTAYRQYVFWNWGKLGRYNRIPIPSCSVKEVRARFPNDAGMPYTGFKLP